jgi:hypothetical protein
VGTERELAQTTSMAAVRSPTETEATDELLISWRLEALKRAGYDESAALLLAVQVQIDLHTATDLLSGGCPPETALRILL